MLGQPGPLIWDILAGGRFYSARREIQMADENQSAEDQILLEGIQVPAALGVTKAERDMRRPVTLDLVVYRNLARAGRTDQIRDTVHYQHIYDVVADVAGNHDHKLVEALGQRIATAVLEKFDVDRIRVTVRKPKPISGVLEYAGIRITRDRNS